MGRDWKKKLKNKVFDKGREFMEEKVEEVKEKLKDKVEDNLDEVKATEPETPLQAETEEPPFDPDPSGGEKEVKSDTEVKKAEAETSSPKQPVTEKKELTPEEQRSASAMVLQIVLFGDGVLETKNIQNIGSRAMAEYMVSRAKDDYNKADIANLCAVRLIDLINQGKKKGNKTGGIWTPGQK